MQCSLSHRQTLWQAGLLAPAMLAPLWLVGTVLVGPVIPLGNLAGYVLVPLLAVSTYTDLRWKIIPNYATYSALLWALGLNAAASLAGCFSPAIAAKLATHLGAIGIGPSLLGAAVCFAITYAFYTARGFGGGDIKLATAIGALLGWQVGMSVLFWCALTATLCGVVVIVWQMGPLTLLADLARGVACCLCPTCCTPPQDRLGQLLHTPTPMALYFLIGTTIALLEAAGL